MSRVLTIGFLFASVLAAQRYGARGGVVFTNPSGFGNVAHPGTGSIPTATFPQRFGATISGTPVGPYGNGARRSRGSAAYPVFVGGGFIGDYGAYGGYGGDPNAYGYGAQGQPPVNVTVVNAPPQAPTVIINQNYGPQAQPDPYGNDTTHISQPAAPTVAPTGDSEPPEPHYVLVAFKDHSVYSALAYWIEDKTLHYVTPQNTHNQASLDLVDLEFTKKLNNQR